MMYPEAVSTLESDQARIELLQALVAENPELELVDKPVDFPVMPVGFDVYLTKELR